MERNGCSCCGSERFSHTGGAPLGVSSTFGEPDPQLLSVYGPLSDQRPDLRDWLILTGGAPLGVSSTVEEPVMQSESLSAGSGAVGI
jgi:hypothetical protein